jgi:hypothetical protein
MKRQRRKSDLDSDDGVRDVESLLDSVFCGWEGALCAVVLLEFVFCSSI